MKIDRVTASHRPGTPIDDALKNAKALASRHDCEVVFLFNDREFVVNPGSLTGDLMDEYYRRTTPIGP